MTAPDGELLRGRYDDRRLTERLLEPMFHRGKGFTLLLAFSGLGTFVYVLAIVYTITTGVGTWGNNIPVAWGFAIINFVWWIGIGHAGTFISAILLILEQKWRTSLNRIAEGMTLVALVQAGLMPLLHLGRPWFFYWLVPYPATMGVWPQFMSTLPWDVAAIATYSFISLLFWYLGAVPDFATVRDTSVGLAKKRFYGLLSLGFRGSGRQWRHHQSAQLLLAALATPLVLSVHSIVGLDFSTTALPGWHSVIFPPYFVAGAIFSGLAMVVQLTVPIRRVYRLHDFITERHFDLIGKMMLVTGMIVTYAYLAELFMAWYSAEDFERFMALESRLFGPYAWAVWATYFCNVVAIQPLWFKKVRTNPLALFVIACFVQLGMWLERFMLVVTSLAQDFLPSSWGSYTPSVVDAAIFCGSMSCFVFLFLLMLKYVPFLPIAELKEMNRELGEKSARPADRARVEGEVLA